MTISGEPDSSSSEFNPDGAVNNAPTLLAHDPDESILGSPLQLMNTVISSSPASPSAAVSSCTNNANLGCTNSEVTPERSGKSVAVVESAETIPVSFNPSSDSTVQTRRSTARGFMERKSIIKNAKSPSLSERKDKKNRPISAEKTHSISFRDEVEPDVEDIVEVECWKEHNVTMMASKSSGQCCVIL